MYLNSNSLNFRRKRRNNPNRMGLYLALILVGLFFIRQQQTGEITPIGVPTPEPTRTALSYAQQAEREFSAGQLDRAAEAYRQATESDPSNVNYWIALARVQAYAGLTEEAVQSAETAVLLDNENSYAHAVYALALDWNFQPEEASDAAVKAISLDGNNALAHAYYAEALTDLGRYAQAGDSIRLAISLDPNSMDVRRVYGYFLENVGSYEDAIQQYQAAATINPNLPFLYIRLGANYRVLNAYETAIESFQRASALDPTDLVPLFAISRTYFQTGEYGRAAQYLEAAIEIDPDNPGIYARRAMVFVRSLNYEGALLDFGCALEGCLLNSDNDVIGFRCPDYGCPAGFETFSVDLNQVVAQIREFETAATATAVSLSGEEGAANVASDDEDLSDEEIVSAISPGEQVVTYRCPIEAGCPENGIPVAIVYPIGLDDGSLEYYYSYPSVLAAYLRCDEAIPLLSKVSAFAADNEIVQGIVQENLNICATADAQSAGGDPKETVEPPEAAATPAPGQNDAHQTSATAAPVPTP